MYQAVLPHVSGCDEQILGQVLLYQVILVTKTKLKTVFDVLDQQSLLAAQLYHAIDNQRVLSYQHTSTMLLTTVLTNQQSLLAAQLYHDIDNQRVLSYQHTSTTVLTTVLTNQQSLLAAHLYHGIDNSIDKPAVSPTSTPLPRY